MMEIPIGWVLTAVIALCGTISGMALTIWMFMKERLNKQDVIIGSQGTTIEKQEIMMEKQEMMIHKLQEDVQRLSGGCGVDACMWKRR